MFYVILANEPSIQIVSPGFGKRDDCLTWIKANWKRLVVPLQMIGS
jgi:hypothetical protein